MPAHTVVLRALRAIPDAGAEAGDLIILRPGDATRPVLVQHVPADTSAAVLAVLADGAATIELVEGAPAVDDHGLGQVPGRVLKTGTNDAVGSPPDLLTALRDRYGAHPRPLALLR